MDFRVLHEERLLLRLGNLGECVALEQPGIEQVTNSFSLGFTQTLTTTNAEGKIVLAVLDSTISIQKTL